MSWLYESIGFLVRCVPGDVGLSTGGLRGLSGVEVRAVVGLRAVIWTCWTTRDNSKSERKDKTNDWLDKELMPIN